MENKLICKFRSVINKPASNPTSTTGPALFVSDPTAFPTWDDE